MGVSARFCRELKEEGTLLALKGENKLHPEKKGGRGRGVPIPGFGSGIAISGENQEP